MPNENVGVFGRSKNKFFIKEYIFVDERVKDYEKHMYGNINNYFIRVDAIELILARKQEVISCHKIERNFDTFDIESLSVRRQ